VDIWSIFPVLVFCTKKILATLFTTLLTVSLRAAFKIFSQRKFFNPLAKFFFGGKKLVNWANLARPRGGIFFPGWTIINVIFFGETFVPLKI
jgi:hypothetical protein